MRPDGTLWSLTGQYVGGEVPAPPGLAFPGFPGAQCRCANLGPLEALAPARAPAPAPITPPPAGGRRV